MDSMENAIESTEPRAPKRLWKVYLALTLSCWGDNMWIFAGGLFMLKLQPETLRLTALYGLVLASTVITLGAPLGKWIDCTGRLTAAKICLLVQNVSVSICAVALSIFLYWKENIVENGNGNGGETDENSAHLVQTFMIVTIVVVIFFSAVAKLSSSGMNIILLKDWIVVINENDSDMLAKMNSILRTIELTTLMLAPVLVGQLFSFLGYVPTGLFVAGWNICSVMVEFGLLNNIYWSHPKLQLARSHKEPADVEMEEINAGNNIKKGNINSVEEEVLEKFIEPITDVLEKDKLEEEEEKGEKEEEKEKMIETAIIESQSGGNVFIRAFAGWTIYFHHPVRNAGLGLSLLYMTVLGFDNITYGYVLTQGVPEYILGILVAISAILGVAGSVTYPFMKKAVGLERTGLFGMCLLVSVSSLAVVSTFLPGSPFLLLQIIEEKNDNKTSEILTIEEQEKEILEAKADTSADNLTSVAVFLCGIIMARFGLWITDLTVSQILQERVEEDRRGQVNGVQDSLNNFLDLVKCILVIVLPYPNQFGFLVIFSFISITTGWVSYATYSRKQRGHLFHPCDYYLHKKLFSSKKPDKKENKNNNNKQEIDTNE